MTKEQEFEKLFLNMQGVPPLNHGVESRIHANTAPDYLLPFAQIGRKDALWTYSEGIDTYCAMSKRAGMAGVEHKGKEQPYDLATWKTYGDMGITQERACAIDEKTIRELMQHEPIPELNWTDKDYWAIIITDTAVTQATYILNRLDILLKARPQVDRPQKHSPTDGKGKLLIDLDHAIHIPGTVIDKHNGEQFWAALWYKIATSSHEGTAAYRSRPVEQVVQNGIARTAEHQRQDRANR